MNKEDCQVTSEESGLKEEESHVCEAELKPAEVRCVLSNNKYRFKKHDSKKTIIVKHLYALSLHPYVFFWSCMDKKDVGKKTAIFVP